MVNKWEMVILITLVIAFSVPFIDQPYSIDDPFTLIGGRAVLSNPAEPYNGESFWFLEPGVLFDEFKNPPLLLYYSALIIKLFGTSERALHIAFVPFFFIAAVSFFLLARRYLVNPMMATTTFLVLPPVLVHSHQVMPDIACLAFFLLGLELLIRGKERESSMILCLAGLCGGIAGLLKYSGLLWLPCSLSLLLVAGSSAKQLKGISLAPGIAAIMQAMWALYSYAVYGQIHLLHSFSGMFYSGPEFLEKTVVMIIHLGGSFIFFLPALFYRSGKRFPLIVAVWLGLLIPVIAHFRYFPSLTLITVSGFLLSGVTVLLSCLVFPRLKTGEQDFKHSSKGVRDTPFYKTFFSWMLWGFAFTLFFTPFMASRYILLWLAPVLIMLVKVINSTENNVVSYLQKTAVFLTILLGLATSLSSLQFSRGQASLASEITSRFPQQSVFFTGHWGFQYYMETHGFRPLSYGQEIPLGSHLVIGSPAGGQPVEEKTLENSAVVNRLIIRSEFPLVLMDQRWGTGFYLHTFGPLPYLFGDGGSMEAEIRVMVAPHNITSNP